MTFTGGHREAVQPERHVGVRRAPSGERAAQPVLDLQRLAGNGAVSGLLGGRRVVVQRALAGDLQELFRGVTTKEAVLEKVAMAPFTERQEVFANGGLIKLAETKLAGKDFPEFLHALHVNADTTTGQLSGFESPGLAAKGVEGAITEQFGKAIGDDALGKKDLAESLVVLPTDRFVTVALRYWPKKSAKDFETVSGFNEDDKVFIDAGKMTDVGTLIHESIHYFAPNTFVTAFGNDLNEGVTEHFARSTINKLRLDIARTKYQSEYLYASAFTAYVGEEAMRKAYFSGNVDALKTAFVEKRVLRENETSKAALQLWDRFVSDSADRETMMTFLFSHGALAGEHVEKITLLRKIEARQNDIAGKIQAIKQSVTGQWTTQMTNDLGGQARIKANQVYTGVADHDLAPLAAEMEERFEAVEAAADAFAKIVRNRPAATEWADKLFVVASGGPVDLAALKKYSTDLVEAQKTIPSVVVAEDDNEETFATGSLWGGDDEEF